MIKINIERAEIKNRFSRLYKIDGLISISPFEQSLQWLKNKGINVLGKIGPRGYRLGSEILQLKIVIEVKVSHSWLVVILKNINQEGEEELRRKWRKTEERIRKVLNEY